MIGQPKPWLIFITFRANLEISTKFSIGDKVIARTQVSEKVGVVDSIETRTERVVCLDKTDVLYYIKFPEDTDGIPWLYQQAQLTLYSETAPMV